MNINSNNTQDDYPINQYKKRSIEVTPNFYFDTDLVSVPLEYKKYISQVVITYGFIIDRIEKIARQIVEENGHKDITLLVIMKSSLLFSHYLLKYITEIKKSKDYGGNVYYEYISSTSYLNDKSTGEVKINTPESIFKNLKGKDVIIIEDMYDTGNSLDHLIKYINKFELKSLKIAMLFLKKNKANLIYKLFIDYLCFIVEANAFVIGFGMDYNELFRDLNHLCLCSDEGLKLLKEKFKN